MTTVKCARRAALRRVDDLAGVCYNNATKGGMCVYKVFELCRADELSPYKTFECGQCFRWNDDGSGGYSGVASGRAARVFTSADAACVECEEADLGFWREYLDMDTDYASARESVMVGDYLTECAEYGRGIRILRQDKWEALCSFIISQCNNIPRIKSIVEKLCGLFGEEFDTPWGAKHAFPGAGRIARLEEPELAPLRAGYRAAYIINAARAVDSGDIDLDYAAALNGDEARKYLKTLNGVGDKVANCAVLFGLHRLDAFPVDVWIKRALKEHMPPDFDPKSLGEYAGLAQQYMFFHARETSKSQ